MTANGIDGDFTVVDTVSPTYFFPEDAMEPDAVPAELTAALSYDKVRETALRAAGLSDRSLQAITETINSARTVEGLPDEDAVRNSST